MENQVKAITVVPDYRDKKKWIARFMTIVRDKNKRLVWKPLDVFSWGSDWGIVYTYAHNRAVQDGVPLLTGLNRGQPVLLMEKYILANMGITCPKK